MLYKTLIVLSIIAVFTAMLFTPNGPTLPFNPTIPTFSNGPAVVISTGDWIVSKSNFSVYHVTITPNATYGNFHGCSLADYTNCINDPNGPDLNTSIVRNYGRVMVTEGHSLGFNFSFSPSGKYLTGLIFSIRCNTPIGETPFDALVDIFTIAGAPSGVGGLGLFKCPNPLDNIFPQVDVPMKIDLGAADVSGITQVSVLIDAADPGPNVDLIQNITYITAHATYASSATPGCAPNDFWCGLAHFIAGFYSALSFFVNGVFWFITLLGNIVQLIINYFSIIIWLFNIPGMPVIIQGYIDAVLSTWLVVISIEIFKLVKPFGGS